MKASNLFYSTNPLVVPQRMLEALRQLQTYASKPVLSSIYIYDLVDQHTLCASYPVASLLGYTADKIHAMGAVGLASLIHPDDLTQVAEHYQRFATLRDGEVISIEYRMRRADGTWCWLCSRETALVQAIDGMPLQVLGLIQDLTLVSTSSDRKLTPLRRTLIGRRRLTQRTGTSKKTRQQRDQAASKASQRVF